MPSVKCPRCGSQAGSGGPLNLVSLPEKGCQSSNPKALRRILWEMYATEQVWLPQNAACPPFIAAYSCGTNICAVLDSYLPCLSPSPSTSAQLQQATQLCSDGVLLVNIPLA